MYVIPKPGLKIPDPARRDFLPETGREVPDDVYWAKLVTWGDVTVKVEDAAPKSRAAKAREIES